MLQRPGIPPGRTRIMGDDTVTVRTISAALAVAAALALAACGGGGGGGSAPSTSMPTAPAQPTARTIHEADPGGAVNAASEAANALPAFGSVTQSTSHNIAGISTDAASTSFDGRNLTLRIDRQDASTLTLGTAGARSTGPNQISPTRSTQSWAVVEADGRSATYAPVYVNWNSADPTDYLAGGYWLHVTGDVTAGTVTGMEAGAFVDGPELAMSAPPNMPVQGTARYAGSARAIYGSRAGTDSPGTAPGTVEIGEALALADLTADFGAGTISGCLGCRGEISYQGVVADGATGETYETTYTSTGTRVLMGATPFNADGTFRGMNVTLETEVPAVVIKNTGAWGGRFSNIPDSVGDPRLVAGTAGGELETAGGTVILFVGTFTAGKVSQ